MHRPPLCRRTTASEAMSAERGWIGDPQPSVEWRDSHYSRQADREASKAEFGFYPASVKPEDVERTRAQLAEQRPVAREGRGIVTHLRATRP